MHTIRATILIEAPVDHVWEVLADSESYQDWNPFITSVTGGDLSTGSRPTLRIVPPGRKAMTFRPRIVEASPEAGLRWVGHLVVPGLCDARHELLLADLPGGRTRLSQVETFRGVLVPVLRGLMEPTRRGFEAMNVAVKARAEARRVPSLESEERSRPAATRAHTADHRLPLGLLQGS